MIQLLLKAYLICLLLVIPSKYFAAPVFSTLETLIKFQFNLVECTFIDYILNRKGYKCLDLTGKVIISRNAIFNEHSFPYTRKSTSSVPPTSVPQQFSPTQALIPIISSNSGESPTQTQFHTNLPSSTNANPTLNPILIPLLHQMPTLLY